MTTPAVDATGASPTGLGLRVDRPNGHRIELYGPAPKTRSIDDFAREFGGPPEAPIERPGAASNVAR